MVVKSLLTRNPEERLSIKKILKMDWFKAHVTYDAPTERASRADTDPKASDELLKGKMKLLRDKHKWEEPEGWEEPDSGSESQKQGG